MRSRIFLGCLVAAALVAAGCPLPSPAVVPGPGEEKKETEAAEPTPPPSFAGTWTRQGEPKLVFTVTDDGATAKGERASGGEADFSAYAFELKHEGQGLRGKASFVLADVPGKTYDATWKATLEGSTIKVAGEELEIDPETNEVTKRDPKQLVFDFAAAAPAAPVMPAMPVMDMSAHVTPAASYKHLLTDDIAVGHWADVETETAAGKSVARTAVVAETGDGWFIELDNQMSQKDLILAVLVDKATGETKKAWVGSRGKEAKEKQVPAPPPAGEAPAGVDEEVTVKAGRFKARKTENQGLTSWVGIEGDAEHVPLKTASASFNEELTALEKVTVEVSGSSYEAKHLTYDSGRELWMAIGKQPHARAMLRMKATGMDLRLTAQGEDAKPAMDYPR